MACERARSYLLEMRKLSLLASIVMLGLVTGGSAIMAVFLLVFWTVSARFELAGYLGALTLVGVVFLFIQLRRLRAEQS